jgi:hypothetical protein
MTALPFVDEAASVVFEQTRIVAASNFLRRLYPRRRERLMFFYPALYIASLE